MSLKKQYLKSRPECKVTFSISKEEMNGGSKVSVVGDFNNWEKASHPLKKRKRGDYSVQLKLPTGKSYEYKYLVDDTDWILDSADDGRIQVEGFNTENSVVSLHKE
ncbi:MAG: isoamylase early set domain-containing protein [Chitinivibrionales bacterium]